MRVISGYFRSPLELINISTLTWYLRWGKWSDENGDHWYEETIEGTPTMDQIKSIINDFYNEQTLLEILSGFEYNGKKIWLSLENLINYKSLYDLACDNVVIKVKEDDYMTFSTFSAYRLFYLSMVAYIRDTIRSGWMAKDSFDYTPYESIINEL